MFKYSWKPGSRMAVRADVAGTELERIREANGGTLEPQIVVDAARRPDAPLHPCFEWDDTRAAEHWRKVEARQVIHNLYVIREPENPEDDPRHEVAYVHLSTEEDGPCYMTAATVLSDEDLRDRALTEALTTLRGFRRRYDHLTELSEVFKAIDRTSQRREKKGRTAARA